MGEFFNLDNKFFQAINKVVDCCGLSILWVICSIPIVTAGTATTALYYTINKVIRHGRGYVWSEYWHAFRTNFKQSAIAWLIVLLALALMVSDGYIMYQYAMQGETIGSIYIMFVVLFVLICMWANYIFPYIARFENTMKRIFKNTAVIAVANLPWTILMIVIFALCCVAVYLFPVVLIILPALYMLFVNLIMERIFSKYMSEEDKAEEEERNREYHN